MRIKGEWLNIEIDRFSIEKESVHVALPPYSVSGMQGPGVSITVFAFPGSIVRSEIWFYLSYGAAIDDDDFATHERVAIANHKGGVLSQFFGPAKAAN